MKSIEEAKRLIHDYIRYYNHQRIQDVSHAQTSAYMHKPAKKRAKEGYISPSCLTHPFSEFQGAVKCSP
ncbi:IS3 family transposase [Thermolongibacillus altinsuensis]|uniref:IS3 family transposase n=1 Tax=Thermolongibacillus altinsuensis TaxID=575256 RepID=UPI0034D3E9D4